MLLGRMLHVNVKRAVMGSKGAWKTRAIVKSKVFCDWLMLNIFVSIF